MILPPSLSIEGSVRVLQDMDGLMLSGGTDLSPQRFGWQPQPDLGPLEPFRDEQEFALVQEAQRLCLPMLGICRGMQFINAVLGGTVIQNLDTSIQHRQKAPAWFRHHHVDILGGTILAQALGEGTIGVNSYHHQAVDKIGDGLRVSATAPDGVVEAIERLDPWFLGVQWHPEMMVQRYDEFLGIFKMFVSACKRDK